MPNRKKSLYVVGLKENMKKLTNEKKIFLDECHKEYKEKNKCVDTYCQYIETVSTREIVEMSNGELMQVTAGSDHDLARVCRENQPLASKKERND